MINNLKNNNNRIITTIIIIIINIILLNNNAYGQIVNAQSQYKNIYPFPNLLGSTDPGFSHFPLFEDLILHIRCYYNRDGEIGDIILFDSGLPMFSTSFGNVIQMLISNNTMTKLGLSTACFFDRYGYGWSEISPKPIMAQDFARKLRGSMQMIPELANRKFFYCGWSYGGLNAQTYAMLYPNDIKGILTIDGTDIGVMNDPKWLMIPRFLDMINYFKRLPNEEFKQFCKNGSLSIDYGWISNAISLPQSCIDKSQAVYYNPNQNYLNTIYQELSNMIPNANALNKMYKIAPNPSKPLGNLPMVVMSSDPDDEPSWFERQIKLSELSSNSIQLNCQNHFVPFYQPKLIINAIEVLSAKSK
ncbi:hypothetical protein ACTFIV_002247 [Dictyostelium citrinum]